MASPVPLTPELRAEVEYRLALDASLQPNNQPSISEETARNRILFREDGDPVPTYTQESTDPPACCAQHHTPQAVSNFFRAIEGGRIAELEAQLNSGMPVDRLSNFTNMTPVYAAVRANQSQAMFTLVNANADVNRLSADPDIHAPYEVRDKIPSTRTPLMRAAADGNIRLVKDLVEQCNADPMIVAPDGQTAQRLAAKARHRDIVIYLPVNRGGLWARLRYDYYTRWHVIRTISHGIYSFCKFFVWHVPKFFLYTLPKWILIRLWRFVKSIYDLIPPVKEWPQIIWRAIVAVYRAFTGAMRATGEAAVKGAKGAYNGTVAGIKAVPRVARVGLRAAGQAAAGTYRGTKRAVKATGRGIVWVGKAIPRATVKTYKASVRVAVATPGAIVRATKAVGRGIKTVAQWFWAALKALGRLLMTVLESIANLFATLYFYLESLIKRLQAVTWEDVVQAVSDVFKAIFITFPSAVWSGIVKTVKLIDKFLTKLTIGIWWILSRIAWILWAIIMYVPVELGRILVVIANGIGRVFTELWHFIHPRSMG